MKLTKTGIIALLLALIMTFSLAACGGNNSNSGGNNSPSTPPASSGNNSTPSGGNTNTPPPSPPPAQSQTDNSTPAPSGNDNTPPPSNTPNQSQTANNDLPPSNNDNGASTSPDTLIVPGEGMTLEEYIESITSELKLGRSATSHKTGQLEVLLKDVDGFCQKAGCSAEETEVHQKIAVAQFFDGVAELLAAGDNMGAEGVWKGRRGTASNDSRALHNELNP